MLPDYFNLFDRKYINANYDTARDSQVAKHVKKEIRVLAGSNHQDVKILKDRIDNVKQSFKQAKKRVEERKNKTEIYVRNL